MRTTRTISITMATIMIGSIAFAAPPDGKGGGKGGDGGEDPPAETFVPAIAYFQEGRKSKDLRLANRAGDQACIVLQSSDGSPKLRGFAYDAANKRLAYSIGEKGVYITDWSNDPCNVGSSPPIRALPDGVHPEFMDFSPSGRRLVWSENDPSFNSMTLWTYDSVTDGVTSLPLQGWTIFGMRFSPEFDPTDSSPDELIFVGGNNDGTTGQAISLFAYDINASISDTNPRMIFDASDAGAYLDAFVTVTNPLGTGDARIAVTDNVSKQILQFSLDGIPQGDSFAGYEPAYSCDNAVLIHSYDARRGKNATYITSSDGNSSELWSGSNLRWFDWFC